MATKQFQAGRLVLTLLLSVLIFTAKAQLSTSRIFGDHMVLQRNQPVNVWGWSKPKAKVTVEINGERQSTKADKNGNWKVSLAPMAAGGPYSMEVTSGKEKLSYNDVMLGEVWVCSGQSNMEFVLKNADTYKSELKTADKQTIRQFLVPKKMSLDPEKNFESGSWAVPNINTIGDFTAVGYYFAKQLAAQLHVTVGLIHSSWGGSQAECWISRSSMLSSPEFADYTRQQPTNWDSLKAKTAAEIKAYAYNNKPVVNYTADELAAKPVAFFDSWKTGTTGSWSWQNKWGPFKGNGFMQHSFKFDDAHAQMASTLRMGFTDADMSIYINGKPVVTQNLPANHQVDLPAGTWQNGDNSLFIELRSPQKNFSWFGMGIAGDQHDLYITFPDTNVTLFDNKWHMMADFSKPYHIELMTNNTITTLYNGMISPITQLSIAGFAWYQGETNAGRAYQYRTVLPLLINDWRKQWKKDLPFMIVQLPSYGPTQNSNQGSTWAELREAQTYTLKLPNTSMAVTYDTSDPNNLHPTTKAIVGYRLANAALNEVYKKPGFALSPMFDKAEFSNGAALVSFKTTDTLVIKDKYQYLKGFELAGADHKFYYAKAQLVNNQVKVWCDEVPQPVAVRYAWSDSPVDANLYNKQGVPVAPFRSDDWKGITENGKLQNN